MSPISLVGLRQVALAHCCARAPSEPCMRIPTHTAQASKEAPNSGAGDSAPFFLMTPLIVRRWQVECTRRIQVSSGVSGSTETARWCLVIALRTAENHSSHSRVIWSSPGDHGCDLCGCVEHGVRDAASQVTAMITGSAQD